MRRLCRLLVLSMVAIATPALAESAEGKAKEAAFARKVLFDFSECVVQSQREVARKFVLSQPDERLARDEFQKVVNPRCLGFLRGRLQMRREQYRAALAERLIAREWAAKAPIDAAQIPALDWPEPRPPVTTDRRTGKPLEGEALAAAQLTYDRAVAERYLGRLGECIVRRDAAGSKALLVTRIGDPAEGEAFRAIGPAIPACVPKGEKLSLNRSTLRDAVAISYYRLAVATAPSGATS